MNGNWVKIFTKFLNWEWYKDQNTKALFIHCLLSANWKDGKFEGYDVPRGSFVTGRQKLARELGITEQGVRTALKHLISTNELTIKKTNKFSIISIVNFEKYQQINQQINQQTNQQLTNNQPTTNQQLTTIEEYKNNRILDNSVCNNAHACEENFYCHLGCKYKTINCKDCMKKYLCPIEDDPMFKALYGKTFNEYITELENHKNKVTEELESMKNNANQDLEIFDLFDEEDERN